MIHHLVLKYLEGRCAADFLVNSQLHNFYLLKQKWYHIESPQNQCKNTALTPTISKYRFSVPSPPTWNVAHSIRGPEPDASGNYQDPLGLNELPIVAFSSHFESTSGTMSHNEGGSQTGCAWLRIQSSICMAESMNKDGLFHLAPLMLLLPQREEKKVGGECICLISAWLLLHAVFLSQVIISLSSVSYTVFLSYSSSVEWQHANLDYLFK